MAELVWVTSLIPARKHAHAGGSMNVSKKMRGGAGRGGAGVGAGRGGAGRGTHLSKSLLRTFSTSVLIDLNFAMHAPRCSGAS